MQVLYHQVGTVSSDPGHSGKDAHGSLVLVWQSSLQWK